MRSLARKTVQEDVDRLIDQVIANPARGEDVKRLLGYKLARTGGPAIDKPRIVTSETDEDLDDLWDNVPV